MSENFLVAGTILADRYEVGAQLGSGGFGATYRATDRARFGTPCVVKELLPARQSNEVARRLFEREARLLSDLSHPQIPKLDAYFEYDGRFILIQEYVEGETLAARLQRETRLGEAEVRQIVLQLLDVLVYLHGRTPPVIHRDIKPANIILASDGRVVLIDFGAVREAVWRDETHTTIGTAGYTPLEQVAGHATPASDCYALGATALQMISGTHPVDWHDRSSGQLAFEGRVSCTPSFEAFLSGMMADVSRRVPDARAARELLLGGATALGGGRAAFEGASPSATTNSPKPTGSGRAAAAGGGTASPVDVPGKGRVVPPAPRRSVWRLAIPLTAAVAAAAAWIVFGGGEANHETTDGAPAGTSVADSSRTPNATAPCAQPKTITHRTESQFDLHVLCPTAWSAVPVAPVRSTRVSAPDRSTEIWAGLWRPTTSSEQPEAFAERWRVALAPFLGEITLEMADRPDDALVRYAVRAAAEGRVRRGSLQIERASLLGADAYMTWSLMLGATDATRPIALQVLGSIEYRDPAAPAAGETPEPVR